MSRMQSITQLAGNSLSCGGHWSDYARYWNLVGSPLRPRLEDVHLYHDLLTGHLGPTSGEIRNALLFGVTPELAAHRWPAQFRLFAVERVPNTIAALWPGNNAVRHAVCADWLRPPFGTGQFDLAIGDGCLVAVGAADRQSRLLAATWSSLRKGGSLCMRCFCLPETPESVGAVFDALERGLVGSFHAFKWRLAMALQGDASDFPVAEIWRTWSATGIDRDRVAASCKWPRASIDTIDVYRNSSLRYRFARHDDLLAQLRAAGFEHVATRYGHYELAERCPVILLRRSSEAPVAAEDVLP